MEEKVKGAEEVAVKKDDIFSRVSADNAAGVLELLNEDKERVNNVDEHGMTPLQHAAYKGNKAMCQILLDYVRGFTRK